MMSPPISCPVVKVPEVVPCPESELDALVAFLESDASIDATRAFARGTLLPDGRLDLCKQSVGAGGCARITSALQGNSQVKSVLLGTDAIGDEGALAVARLIEANPHLEVVYLGCNGITERGAQELARVLADNTSVKGLWLKRNPIGDGGVRSLACMLATNTHLQILDIVNGGFSLPAFAELCAALGKSNHSLKRLYAGGNGLSDASLLCKMLADGAALEGLFLNVGSLGDKGACELAGGVCRSSHLRELGLGSNGVGLEGLKALSQCSALESLDLGRSASQTVLGAPGNDFAGGGELIGEILGNNRMLKRLNLRGTKLNQRDFDPIFDAAAKHSALGELLLDKKMRDDVKANLQANQTRHPFGGDLGVSLIKSVYRTAPSPAKSTP